MPYSPRITIEDYVMSMLRLDMAKLPPRKPGCYGVWLSDFAGNEPQPSDKDKLVWVGKTDDGLLYRVTGCVLDAIGITGAGPLSGTEHSYFHVGGREIFLKHGNAKARLLLLTWRDDICPSCEEYRIYGMRGINTLNKRQVSPCPMSNHPLPAVTPF